MIRIEVQPYCENCRVFEADVEKPEVTFMDSPYSHERLTHQTDTVVRCVRRKQCENIKRYLEQQQAKENA